VARRSCSSSRSSTRAPLTWRPPSARCSAAPPPAQRTGTQRTLSDELRGIQTPPADAPLPQAIAGTASRSATLTGDLTIVPDARANSLLVRANRTDFEAHPGRDHADRRSAAQVLIEVVIVEARRDHSFNLGVD
jgi:type II secretory pathway component GspD/PulD (secretin)